MTTNLVHLLIGETNRLIAEQLAAASDDGRINARFAGERHVQVVPIRLTTVVTVHIELRSAAG